MYVFYENLDLKNVTILIFMQIWVLTHKISTCTLKLDRCSLIWSNILNTVHVFKSQTLNFQGQYMYPVIHDSKSSIHVTSSCFLYFKYQYTHVHVHTSSLAKCPIHRVLSS